METTNKKIPMRSITLPDGRRVAAGQAKEGGRNGWYVSFLKPHGLAVIETRLLISEEALKALFQIVTSTDLETKTVTMSPKIANDLDDIFERLEKNPVTKALNARDFIRAEIFKNSHVTARKGRGKK